MHSQAAGSPADWKSAVRQVGNLRCATHSAASSAEHPSERTMRSAAAVGQEHFGGVGRAIRDFVVGDFAGQPCDQLRVGGVASEVLSQSATEDERQKLLLSCHKLFCAVIFAAAIMHASLGHW